MTIAIVCSTECICCIADWSMNPTLYIASLNENTSCSISWQSCTVIAETTRCTCVNTSCQISKILCRIYGQFTRLVPGNNNIKVALGVTIRNIDDFLSGTFIRCRTICKIDIAIFCTKLNIGIVCKRS